ncbi:HD domain-containing protein [Salipaludibacillus agaradhaerens]|uniref:HD-GYP domain-containing protein n=1 Tax=Salipaludibacillus agaradhaerens TaxID=76935 RepID=UPI0021519CA1|nr:HD domain-containing phosphohydrolase [Salipaludibacillus agaradhaerens]MCR6107244.1 HD domain-containing protein [Salipaludibacillus agaradhaerens]MCR6119273.1 HD domain-containing protein [Salipaludibacillus agaradhaerens]UJW58312.1 HD domain-containing protein [Bacillus sp. A116_S68]
MRYVAIDKVEQGEKLGKHIFSSDGRILLSEGITLTVGLISKLRHMGVNTIFVKDDRFPDLEVEEPISEETKRKAMTALAQSIQYIQEDRPIDGKAISESVEEILNDVMANSDILIHLTEIRTEDNALFVHSVNVCMMSCIIGVQLGLNRIRIQELAVGALLHDIGKLVGEVKATDIPTGYENEEELMNHHAWKGFNVLRKSQEVSTLSAHIALTHHENVDGSGEPRGMIEDDIHFLAKIVAVVNDYDHLISNVKKNGGLFPHEACERIMSLTESRYDHKVVVKFLRCVAFFPTGTQVKLSNGAIGIVTEQHKGLPQRPKVRTFQKEGDHFTFDEVDLAKETTTFITKVYS